ncbi:MAG: type IV pilus assembly protein PilM [Mariprofundales bacterium]|nr:type IV pilus assembly protein PilM [Mariprofundales bacterium]
MKFPMLTSDTTGLIGIDLGTSSLKLVELAKSADGFEVVAHAQVPMPRDCLVENEVVDSILFADALTALMEAAQPTSNQAAIAIAGSALFNMTISLPYAEEFDLELTIHEVAAEYIPFAIEDVYLDFFIQGPREDDPDTMDVVLVACRREVVDDLQLALLDAGLDLALVDGALFALANTLELAPKEDASAEDDSVRDEDGAPVEVLINIGAQMMNVNIMREGRSWLVRDYFFGGERLTNLMQEELHIGFAKAEAAKLHGQISDDVRTQFLDELASEVMRAIDIYATDHGDWPVSCVILTGGVALLPGLVEAMQDRLGVEQVSLWDVGEHLHFVGCERFVSGAQMTMATGLALRAFDG